MRPRRMNGHAKAAVVALAPDEPMVPRRLYDRLRDRLLETEDDLRRTRAAKCQVEEILAQERQIHAADRELRRMSQQC